MNRHQLLACASAEMHNWTRCRFGALIRSDGNYEKRPDANWCWYEPGCTKPFPHHLRATLLDAHLIWHPTWITKGMR